MLCHRSVIKLREGLNLGPSVRSHSKADVGEFRRSLRVKSDGIEGRFVFCAPRAVRSSIE
ncbi:unnamed protein product [Prunus armeniaca]